MNVPFRSIRTGMAIGAAARAVVRGTKSFGQGTSTCARGFITGIKAGYNTEATTRLLADAEKPASANANTSIIIAP